MILLVTQPLKTMENREKSMKMNLKSLRDYNESEPK